MAPPRAIRHGAKDRRLAYARRPDKKRRVALLEICEQSPHDFLSADEAARRSSSHTNMNMMRVSVLSKTVVAALLILI